MHLANYLRRSLGLDCLSRSYLNWIQTTGESSTIQSVLVGTRLLRGPTFFPENQTTVLISVSEYSWWSPFSLRGDSFAGCASSQNHSIFWVGPSLTDYSCKYQHWTILTSQCLRCNLHGEPQGFIQWHNEWSLWFSVPLLTIHNIPSAFFYFFVS